MKKLSEATPGTDNNYNLIRFACACAVLFTHSFALATGDGNMEPLRKSLGLTLGDISVDIFFFISGLLVTASLLKTKSTNIFLWSRFLRIYPALFVMLVITVFGMGLFFTNLPWKSYLGDRAVYSYFLHCVSLVKGVSWVLPGVFLSNPFKEAVNGSLWSLPFEIYMYLILCALFITLRFFCPRQLKIFKILLVFIALSFTALFIISHLLFASSLVWFRISSLFFVGAAYFILKEHIILSTRFFAISLFALLLSILNPKVFFVIYPLILPYLVTYLAYIPSGFIRTYQRFGDYSYGIYIYGFPVQQSLAALIPGISILEMISFSFLCTIPIAMLSWHLLEHKVLKLKKVFINLSEPITTATKLYLSNRLNRPN
jgi:peptidoglycan/LPS O-acetylase OafA/YrhL